MNIKQRKNTKGEMKMSEYERHYNGKRYAKANTIKTKARATKAKEILQKQGYNVRIEDAGGRGYHIYYRGKNWKK